MIQQRIQNCDKKRRQKIPPDGGFGWIIVGSNVISNILSFPLITGFGLIFKDKLQILSMPARDISMIININSAFGMSMGIVTGPLLKIFGYRKISVAAGFMFAVGIIGTAFATTFSQFIITYSLLAAAGYGLTTASFQLALLTYFKERRSKAMGITMALNGLGPIIYPPMITYLLNQFGVTGSVLLLGGLSLNIVVVALLLQPIKYHYIIKDILNDENRTINTMIVADTENNETDSHRQSSSELDSFEENENDYLESIQQLNDFKKIEEIELNSQLSKSIIENENYQLNDNKIPITDLSAAANSLRKIQKHWKITRNWIITFFDLDLICDKIFLNITVGMAIAAFAEINFSVLTPFILNEMNFTTLEIASVLSSVAISDIISRFLAPYLGDILRLGPRGMYMLSLGCLIIARSCYLAVTNYKSLIILSVGLGVSKGVRTVYMVLVIPEYVTIEKLPNANGIRMVFNCIMLIMLGTIIGMGHIVDIYGSYLKCIMFINVVTFTCIAMWATEMLYVKITRR